MSALLKLQVLEKLTTILQEISVANGFHTEITGVYRGRNKFGDETKEPFIAMLEAPRGDMPMWAMEDKTVSKSDWTILIQGFAKTEPFNPLDPAYRFLADVEVQMGKIAATKKDGRAGGLYPEYYMLDGLIASIELEEAVVRPPDGDISTTAFFYQPVRLTLVRNLNCS